MNRNFCKSHNNIFGAIFSQNLPFFTPKPRVFSILWYSSFYMYILCFLKKQPRSHHFPFPFDARLYKTSNRFISFRAFIIFFVHFFAEIQKIRWYQSFNMHRQI